MKSKEIEWFYSKTIYSILPEISSKKVYLWNGYKNVPVTSLFIRNGHVVLSCRNKNNDVVTCSDMTSFFKNKRKSGYKMVGFTNGKSFVLSSPFVTSNKLVFTCIDMISL